MSGNAIVFVGLIILIIFAFFIFGPQFFNAVETTYGPQPVSINFKLIGAALLILVMVVIVAGLAKRG